MDWTHMLAYVTGTVDQELLARNKYLAAENRILKSQLNGRLRLSDAERATLGKIGHRLGRQALAEVDCREAGQHPCLVSTSASASISPASCAMLVASNGVLAGNGGWGCECP
jgi:hypothetical protein